LVVVAKLLFLIFPYFCLAQVFVFVCVMFAFVFPSSVFF